MLETDLQEKQPSPAAADVNLAIAGRAGLAGQACTYHARVYSQNGKNFGVAGPMGCYWLPPAASCLLQPCVGDTVLVSIGPEHGYILAVLEQAEDQPSEVRLPANSQLHAPNGTLTINAPKGLRLNAGTGLKVQAKAASFSFDVMGLQAQRLQVSGDSLRTVWRERHDFAQQQLTVTMRSEQRSGTRTTQITGHDEHSAGSQRILVQRDWRVRANTVSLLAQSKASLDGKQVQLG